MSAESSISPTPWQRHPTYSGVIADAAGRWVAAVCDNEHAPANDALLLAAPDLLAACTEALAWLGLFGQDAPLMSGALAAQLRAAITKATPR